MSVTSLTGTSKSVLMCVQGWSLSCVKSNTIITVPCTICVAACVLGLHLQLTDMQPSEEVYDHLADVRTGPERLATFSRSHSWVGKKQEFTIHLSSIDSGGGEGEKR